jgi:hypothetical protein
MNNVSKLLHQKKIILKFHDGSLVFPIHILFLHFITAVSISVPIYLLDSASYVPYGPSYLFVVEETLCFGVEGITASTHITRKHQSFYRLIQRVIL